MSDMTPPPAGDTGGTAATGATAASTSTPTTGSTPVGGAPSSTTSGGGEYFNQSRMKVIGLITAGVVLVGALGGIAGVAFDPERTDDEELFQPGDGAGSVGSLGNSVTRRSLLSAGPKLPVEDSASPTPVGSATPDSSQSPAATESPVTDESSPPEPSPSPTDDGGSGGDGGEGSAATLAATGVQVYVPPGWEIFGQDDTNLVMSNGQGSFATAFADSGFDPSADAGQIIAQNIEQLFPPENYTQFATGDIQALDPFGSVVSMAGMPYESLWVDNQGSISLHGEIYVGVRQDGTIFIMSIEHTPVEDWDNAPPEMRDIINASYSAFGGLG